MKILVDAEARRILGAARLGIGGDGIVRGLLDVMHAEAPCTESQRAMHIHPIVSEMIPVMLAEPRPLG